MLHVNSHQGFTVDAERVPVCNPYSDQVNRGSCVLLRVYHVMHLLLLVSAAMVMLLVVLAVVMHA